MVAAEAAPLAKVGGLADVVGALPKALEKLDCEITVILPFYGSIDKSAYGPKLLKNGIKVTTGESVEKVSAWECALPNSTVKIVLIKHAVFDGPEIYSSTELWHSAADAAGVKRFAFFNLAVLEVLTALGLKPDIMHCHDWHAGLIPLKLKSEANGFFKGCKTVFTIHNLANQGSFGNELQIFARLNTMHYTMNTTGENNTLMTQGILNADIITTVSPTYAKEILTSEYGAGVEKQLKSRRKDLFGIINGIDTETFSPAADSAIYANYDAKNISKKLENKLRLQKELNLEANPDILTVGLISRLVWQKGLDLITDDFSKINCQLIILGSGQPELEGKFSILAKNNPSKIYFKKELDLKLAQKIYAGCDALLIPSRFEPCGLTQLIAMRYGTVPIVRQTGGLKDTVTLANGFLFKTLNSLVLKKTIQKAISLYTKNKPAWKKLQLRGLKTDFSWSKSAKEYQKLYISLIK